MKRTVRLVLALGMLFVPFVSARPGAAAATTALPFIPPESWRSLRSALLPSPLLSWNQVEPASSFSLTTVSVAIPLSNFAPLMKAQLATLGSSTSSTSLPVCGKPAARVQVRLKATPQILVEQFQTLNGKTYISAYGRPSDTPMDPHIKDVLDHFCGDGSLAKLDPPTGWTATHAQMLGVWIGPTSSQVVTLISSTPTDDANAFATEAAKRTLKGTAVSIVSSTQGLLCGNPASFYTAVAKPPGVPASELRMEMTQSLTSAYILTYVHPAGTPADDAAVRSLQTLCASSQAPMPKQPSPLPSSI